MNQKMLFKTVCISYPFILIEFKENKAIILKQSNSVSSFNIGGNSKTNYGK